MSRLRIERADTAQLEMAKIPREVTDEDRAIYRRLVSTDLTEEQKRRILEPPATYPKQRSVLAVHWHPEFVPMPLIRQRIATLFPNRETELIVPTQHNVLVSYDGFTGVEVDCFSPEFNRKVQLLFHFASDRLDERADVFRSILEHTFNYRTSQLTEFMDTLLDEAFGERVAAAAEETWADDDLVEFVRIHVGRLRAMIDEYETSSPAEMLRNKIVRDYFNQLRGTFDRRLIDHVQIFLKAVKQIVKSDFTLDYFYRTQEVVEEARALGAGIVIPHPEQFWPVLLADLDVDAIEVWNPQSFEYTEFLINVVNRQNRSRKKNKPLLLVTMGDDCHMGEKIKDPAHRDEVKAAREIGVQPPWDDLTVSKSLMLANASRERMIQEYKARLT